jgi:hypothetical protein
MKPLSPIYGTGQTVTTGPSSQSIEITTLVTENITDLSIRVVNKGDYFAYLKIGDESVVATANDLLIAPNTIEVFSKFSPNKYIAYLQDTISTEINIILCYGGL